MKSLLFLLLSFFLHFSIGEKAQAITSPKERFVGKVYAFDAKKAVLEVDGKKWEMPRKLLPQRELKVGENIEVAFKKEDIKKIKPYKNAKK